MSRRVCAHGYRGTPNARIRIPESALRAHNRRCGGTVLGHRGIFVDHACCERCGRRV